MLSNFFDQPTIEIFGQLSLALFLGLLIGIERKISRKFAGMRTYALVSLGSALFSVVSTAFHGPNIDPTRIAAQIVTGIGFLGAGLIVFQGTRIQGLTTAAGIWVAAAIGMAVGFKLYAVAVFATILTILIFVVIWPVEQSFIVKLFREGEENDLD